MNAWKMGAFIVVVVIGLFLVPFFKPELVPMRFHSNADLTKERFIEDMKNSLSNEYDAIIEPEFVHGFTDRSGLNIYHGWYLKRDIEGGGKYFITFFVKEIYFSPSRNLTLEDVLDIPFSYLVKGTWEHGSWHVRYLNVTPVFEYSDTERKMDYINSTEGYFKVKSARELISGNLIHLYIERVSPEEAENFMSLANKAKSP